MIGIIAAVTTNGIIGVEGKLPFDYSNDMKHFRKTTANSTVIMGRKTWESIGRPLPKRTNIVISSSPTPIAGVLVINSLENAIIASKEIGQDIWLIGGAGIYEEGMNYADKIALTLTPDVERRTPAIKFPWISPNKFKLVSVGKLVPEDDSCKLLLATYEKIVL